MMSRINMPLTELLAGLAEECSELCQAALKLRRVYDQTSPTPMKEDEATERFFEEIADVELFLDQIMYPKSYVEQIKKQKLERWARRMGEVKQDEH